MYVKTINKVQLAMEIYLKYIASKISAICFQYDLCMLNQTNTQTKRLTEDVYISKEEFLSWKKSVSQRKQHLKARGCDSDSKKTNFCGEKQKRLVKKKW